MNSQNYITASSHAKSLHILSGLSGILGVLMLGLSFAIVTGPPANASREELLRFGQQHYAGILWGAWLQAVGPVFIVLFAFALVHLAGAMHRLAGWMTLFGAGILMTVSLMEVTCYMAALFPEPAVMTDLSLKLILAIQHLYFIVAAPAVFFPLGFVLIGSRVLPRVFGYLAVALAMTFAGLGIAFQLRLALPDAVTAFAAVQALWWLAASIALIARSGVIAQSALGHASSVEPGGAIVKLE
ncbi:MAG TPA: hypothetical protein VFQ00_14490 [Terriglobales bacterium]|nr:hypothetical protein [Terriglobales bacterium]